MKVSVIPGSTKVGAATIDALLKAKPPHQNEPFAVVGHYRDTAKARTVLVPKGSVTTFTTQENDLMRGPLANIASSDVIVLITPPVTTEEDCRVDSEEPSSWAATRVMAENIREAVCRAESRVQRIVYVSSMGAEFESADDVGEIVTNHVTEQILRTALSTSPNTATTTTTTSTTATTSTVVTSTRASVSPSLTSLVFVRCGHFLDMWGAAVFTILEPPSVSSGMREIVSPLAPEDVMVPMVAVADVAHELVRQALLPLPTDKAAGKNTGVCIIQLQGPRPYSPRDVLHAFVDCLRYGIASNDRLDVADTLCLYCVDVTDLQAYIQREWGVSVAVARSFCNMLAATLPSGVVGRKWQQAIVESTPDGEGEEKGKKCMDGYDVLVEGTTTLEQVVSSLVDEYYIPRSVGITYDESLPES